MAERIVYFNGEFLRESEAKISVTDCGFILGDAAFDTARSINHLPFKWKEHIDRWFYSLRYMQIDIGMNAEEVYETTIEVFKRNEKNLGANDDYWVRWIGTPGQDLFRVPAQPTILIRCELIPFKKFAKKYLDGIHAIIASNRMIPPQCFDPKAKLYSRAHLVQAELEAHSIDPDAIPILLDVNGYVAEGTKQNIFVVKGEKLLTPRRNNILEGVTRALTLDLAKKISIQTLETDLCPYDLYTADEIFITATSYMMLPVSKLSNRPLNKPIPGPVTAKLFSSWNKSVGIDIVQQALSHV